MSIVAGLSENLPTVLIMGALSAGSWWITEVNQTEAEQEHRLTAVEVHIKNLDERLKLMHDGQIRIENILLSQQEK